MSLKTARDGDGRALQDLAYHDPVGDVVQIADNVQQPVFYDGGVVDGTAQFTYEPVYRLSTATGREHAGGFASPRTDVDVPVAPLPHPNDGQALIAYGESYVYDKVGNIQRISHGPPGGAAAWTSPMRYVAGTNRLDQTMVSGDQETDVQWHGRYTYDAHGNMTSMPHLAAIDWDWKDQMQRADLGGGGAVYLRMTQAASARAGMGTRHDRRADLSRRLRLYRQRKSGAVVLERRRCIMDGVKRIAMVETKTDTSVSSLTPTPVIRFQLGNHLSRPCSSSAPPAR